MNVLYHLGKTNIVKDMLCSMAHMKNKVQRLAKEVHRLAHLGVCLLDMDDGVLWFRMVQNHP